MNERIIDFIETNLKEQVSEVVETCEQMRMMGEMFWSEERGLMQGYVGSDDSIHFYVNGTEIRPWKYRFEVYKSGATVLYIFGVAGAPLLQ